MFSVLISSFVDGDGFTFQYIGNVLRDGYYYKLFAFTFSQAILSTIVSLIIGIPIGYFFGKYDFKGRKFLLTFFTVPFVIPSVLVGMGFLGIFGEQESNGAQLILIVLAHAFYNIPLFVHFISAYYKNFDNDIIDAAKTSGSKNFHQLFRVYLPLFLVPILTSSILTFVFCFLSFGVIII
ncbi:MAG: iron ABC transporter permease, partial [Candidatus Heimdallarchaeota archaeon]|nr:iron ABC transporter permease [Candidatus Heimdallarchaeota archaeon]